MCQWSNAIILPAIFFIAIVTARTNQQSKPADFAGYWLRDDGGVIKVSVDGNKLTAIHVKVVPENRDVYGFAPGDAHFEGIVQARTMRGKVMGHLAVAKWKKLCRWVYFVSDRGSERQIWKVPSSGGLPVQVTSHGGFVAMESTDGRFLYFTKKLRMTGLWRMPVQGGEENPIVRQAIPDFYWAVGEKGIYFIDPDTTPRPTLKFFDPVSSRINTLTTFP